MARTTQSAISTETIPLRTRSKPNVQVVKNEQLDEPDLQQQMAILAETAYRENKAQNAAKSRADKAKKELDRLMAQNDIATIELDVDGTWVEAVYEADTENVVDIAELEKIVDRATFLRIISATKKSVADALGDNIANRVLKPVRKEPSLKVRAKK